MSELFWMVEEIATMIHADQIVQHGGSPGIRDENLLSASLARPRHLFAYGEPTLFELAAASPVKVRSTYLDLFTSSYRLAHNNKQDLLL